MWFLLLHTLPKTDITTLSRSLDSGEGSEEGLEGLGEGSEGSGGPNPSAGCMGQSGLPHSKGPLLFAEN